MKMHPTWMLVLLNVVALATGQAVAQNVQFAAGPATMPPQQAVSQAYFTGQPAGQVMPAGFASCGCDDCTGGQIGCDDSCDGGGGCGAGCAGGCGAGCGAKLKGLFSGGCGLGGCGLGGNRFGGYGSQLLGGKHGPFCDGGCCATRWYDAHVEWLFFKREEVSDTVNLSSSGVLGPVVLSTDSLNLDEESGFRFTWAYLVGPGTALEASYFGTFNWSSAAQVNDPTNNLFSVFSDFGTNPGPPQFGFPQTDQAFLHRVDYSSKLNNGELHLRHRWVSANCLLHGSWLLGARYVALEEELTYATRTTAGSLDYTVDTENDLIGAQLGGDIFVCITPRLKLGTELKAGVFGVRAKQHTLAVDGTGTILTEAERDDDAAFVGEFGAMGIFRVTPRLSLRGGYQLVYIDGVALAGDNFNTESPFAARDAVMNTNGDAFYHGATVGFEWTW